MLYEVMEFAPWRCNEWRKVAEFTDISKARRFIRLHGKINADYRIDRTGK